MTNSEINNYRRGNICDAHIHLHVKSRLDKSVSVLRSVTEHFGYDKIVLQSLPFHDATNNYKSLYLKSHIAGAYSGLGLIHNLDNSDTKEYYAAHVRELYRMGCDGFKMIEGKPQYRKVFSRPLCSEVLDPFYEFAQDKKLPVYIHAGDPKEFWDREKIPDWALERGWLYDETFIGLAGVREEITGVLEKFPDLKFVFTHFFFASDDIDYAYEFMQKWKSICFDITPGTEMFFNFEKRSDEWRSFFIKFADRIVFGSDIYNWDRENKTVEKRYGHAVNLVRSFIEKDKPFRDGWTNHLFEHPLNLPDDALYKIYCGNFVRLYGENPRPVDKELVVYNCRKFLESGEISALEKSNLEHIIRDFSGK